jgi:hypothetical protein
LGFKKSAMKTSQLFFQYIFIAFLLAVFTFPARAQNDSQRSSQKTFTLIFQGDSIQYALQKLVKVTHINLVYDPAIMTRRTVYATAKNERPKAILRVILKGSGLDFVQLSSGTFVLTPAPQNPNRFGNITGRVIDRRTGKPLAGANVMLADASGGAATNKTGHFIIPKLTPGFHRITITYVGYKPVQDTIWVPSSATASLNFSLPPKPVLVEPIYVEGIRKRRPPSQSLSGIIHSSQITEPQIMGNADAIKSLNAVSGINFNLPLADFHIQGGSAGSQQVRLDGVPVYNPVNMGYLLGAFNPWAIQKIVVHKAGFPAPVGSELSGVVNMIQDAGDSTQAPFLIEANPLNVNARFTQQFDQHGGSSVNLMIAGRANIWRWYQQPKMRQMLQHWDHLDPLLTLNLFQPDTSRTIFQVQNHSYDITYYDLQAAAEIHHNKFHRTRISAYLGKNALKTDLFSQKKTIPYMDLASSAPDLFYSFDHYNWINYMAKAEHNWLINARLNATISGYVTHHSFDHHYVLTNNRQAHLGNAALLSADFARNKLKQYAAESIKTGDKNAVTQSSAQLALTYQATKNYTLSGGFQTTYLNYRFNLSDLYYNAARTNDTSFLISGYLQNDFLLSRKLSFTAGSRLTFIPRRDLVFAEPRLALKLEEPDTPAGYFSAKLSGGIYRQFINRFDVSNVGPSALVPSIKFWVPVDYTTTVPEAYHVALESLLEPSKSLEIRLESYYKWIPSRLVLDYAKLSAASFIQSGSNDAGQHQFITSARGYAYGLGISAKKRIHSLHMEIRGNYQFSISRQRVPSRFDGNYEPLPSGQPQKVSASIHWNIIPKLTLLLQWQSIRGRSWGFRKAYYDYLSIRKKHLFENLLFDDPGSNRLPRFSQLNAGLSYRVKLGRPSLEFRFDAFNLLNHKNIINWWLTPYHKKDGSLSYRRRSRTMIGFRPSFGIKLSY